MVADSTKHVLILGSGAVDALERHYERAFRAIGFEVTLYEPEAALRALAKHRVINRVTRGFHHAWVSAQMRSFFARPPRVDLVFVFKGFYLSPETIEAA